jgi:hypothetical protein
LLRAIAGNWLAVLGLVALMLGTGAQAWASLSELENLRETCCCSRAPAS